MSVRLRVVQIPLLFAFHDVLTPYQISKFITVFGRQRPLRSERLYVGIQHHRRCYGLESNCDLSRQKLTVVLISRLQRSHFSDRLIEQHQIWHSCDLASWYIPIVKPTWCTIFEFIEYHNICFGRSFRPPSGVLDCTYSVRYMSYRFVDCLLAGSCPLASSQRTCVTYTWRCLYILIFGWPCVLSGCTRQSLAESDDTRGCICTICVVDLMMMGGLRSKHVEEFNLM
jgi:hypothetical protein